MAELIFVTE